MEQKIFSKYTSDWLPSWNRYDIKKYSYLRNIYDLITIYKALLYLLGYSNEENRKTSLSHRISIQ